VVIESVRQGVAVDVGDGFRAACIRAALNAAQDVCRDVDVGQSRSRACALISFHPRHPRRLLEYPA